MDFASRITRHTLRGPVGIIGLKFEDLFLNVFFLFMILLYIYFLPQKTQ